MFVYQNLRRLPGVICAFLLAALWVTTATHSHFSQDSWSYYELSRHFFDDFYRVNTWRQYHLLPGEYGSSFPPLWPLFIAVVNVVFPFGIYAGFVLNFCITAGCFLLLRRMAKSWYGEREIGLVLFLGLVLLPDFTTALFSAATLPLSLLLLLTLLYMLEEKRERPFAGLVLGLLAGLSVLCRFDCLLPAFALLLFMGSFWRGVQYLLALALTLAPWVWYSHSTFDLWWVSDNSRTVLASVPLFVRDYMPDGVSFLWQDPTGWLKRTLAAVLKSADVLFTTTSSLPWLLLPLLWLTKHAVLPRSLLALMVWIGLQTASVLLTGFIETRYYVPLQFLFLALLLYICLPQPLPRHIKPTLIFWFTLAGLALGGAYIAKSVVQHAPLDARFNPAFQKPTDFADILACLPEEGKNAKLLLPPKNASYQFGALTGITSYVQPTNMDAALFPRFLREFTPTHFLTNTPEAYGFSAADAQCKREGWGEEKGTFYLFTLSTTFNSALR